TRLRHEDRKSARRERRIAIAELGGEIDLDRQARKALEPVFGDQSGVVGGAAGRDGYSLELAKIERQRTREPHLLGGHVEIMRERVADDLRLLVNLLGHEVAIIALVDKKGRSRGLEDGAFDLAAFGVEHVDAVARENG